MHTPNLDGLVDRSLLLERAYVQQALCSPSRTSLLTGRRPDTTRVYEIGPYFRKVGGNFTTLPEYFKINGNTTVGMGKVFHSGRASGGDAPVSWSEPYFHGIANFEVNNYSWVAVPEDLLVSKPLIDEQIANHAIETLKRLAPRARSGKQPFFVAAGFRKPHLPFVFPKLFLNFYPSVKQPGNPYAPVDMPDVAWSKFVGLRGYGDIKSLHASGKINTTFPDETVLMLRRAYYSALSLTDSLIGRVLAELDNLGLSNNTIVSFWGDHGYQLGEHGEWCKQTNFELATHSPMMIHVPRMTHKGIKTAQLSEFVDLFPTLVEAAGLKQLPLCMNDSTNTPLCREGTSLLPLIANPDTPINFPISQNPRDIKVNNREIQTMGYTIRTDRYRYTEWPHFKYAPEYRPNWYKLAGVELYDHEKDPEDNYNHANDMNYAKIRKDLSKMLRSGWRNAALTDKT